MEIIDPTEVPNWDELVISNPATSFFHTSSWARVLKETYGYTPKYFTESDGGQILASIPVMEVRSFLTGCRGVSLPFTDYCEPIVNGRREFADLFRGIGEYGKNRGWKYIELRGGSRFFPQTSSLKDHSLNVAPRSSFLGPVHASERYLGHTLRLSENEDQIFSGFRNSTQRNIRKAIKAGIEVKINNSFESIKEFHRLNCMTRKDHGLPPQPFLFFKRIYTNIISKENGFVALASYQNRNIAGGIYFHFGEKALYKYGASDYKYRHLRSNNLFMWEAIKWYCKNGYKSLSFGRTEPENLGLMRYKRGWGTEERTIDYHRISLMSNSFETNCSKIPAYYKKVMRKMPLSFLNVVGSLVYKHIG